MKQRIDYVTNSSSSSYIIGTKDSDWTIESVYQTVRTMYIKLKKGIADAKQYIDQNPDCGMMYKEATYAGSTGVYLNFDVSKGCIWDKVNEKVLDFFYDTFGIVPDMYTDINAPDWTGCESYSEYEKFWQNIREQAPDKHNIHGPFTIFSFEDGIVKKWVHWEGEILQQGIDHTDIGISSSIVGWYFPNIEEAVAHPENCDGCTSRRWCRRNSKQKCLELKERLHNDPIDLDHAGLYMLGKICIASESGYIPSPIVDRLYEIAEYACEHMG